MKKTSRQVVTTCESLRAGCVLKAVLRFQADAHEHEHDGHFDQDADDRGERCAEGHTIKEVDKDWKTLWQIEQKELKDIILYNVAGIQRLTNGNTVICNWQGHGHIGEQPQILEVTREKKGVWQIFDNERFAAPAHVHILNKDGQPDPKEIYR